MATDNKKLKPKPALKKADTTTAKPKVKQPEIVEKVVETKKTNESKISSLVGGMFDKFKTPKILDLESEDSIINAQTTVIQNSDIKYDLYEDQFHKASGNSWLEQEVDSLTNRVNELEYEIIRKNEYIQNLEIQISEVGNAVNQPNIMRANGDINDILDKLTLLHKELKNARLGIGEHAQVGVQYLINKLESEFYFLIS